MANIANAPGDKRKRGDFNSTDIKVSPAGFSYALSTTQPKHVQNKASERGQVKMTKFVTSASTERNKLAHFVHPNLAALCWGLRFKNEDEHKFKIKAIQELRIDNPHFYIDSRAIVYWMKTTAFGSIAES